jgi:hypothetical protein
MKMDRRESDKDAAVSKAVKEIFLKDKIGCNHIGTYLLPALVKPASRNDVPVGSP